MTRTREQKDRRNARVKEWRAANPEAHRAHARRYYDKNKEKIAAYLKARRASRYEVIHALKLERGCDRCGYNEHPAALDFHHRDPSQKAFVIAYAVDYSMKRMMDEIAKCDLFCANCHRILHVSGNR